MMFWPGVKWISPFSAQESKKNKWVPTKSPIIEHPWDLFWTLEFSIIDFCNSLDYSYLNVSRTLCPEQCKTTVVKEIVVDVSTMNYYETRFELVAELEDLAIVLVSTWLYFWGV